MRRALAFILLAASLALPGAAKSAHPTWPHDSTTNVAVCQAEGEQLSPVALPDGSGGVFLVWTDGRALPGHDIYAQHLDAFGRPRWAEGGVVVCATPDDETHPRAITDGTGGILVAWQGQRDGIEWRVHVQCLDSLGIRQWQANGVAVCANAGNQTFPVLASDSAGGAIVAWGDDRNHASRMYAQRIGPGGNLLWSSSGLPVCETPGTQINAAVAPDGAGGAIVAWQDGRVIPTSTVYAQRLGPTGARRWAASGVPACATPGTAYGAVLAPDGRGGAIVTWPDYRTGTYFDIVAQRFDSLGTKLWGAEGVPICDAPQDQYAPALAVDPAGGAIVAWHDYRIYNSLQIRAQRISHSGAPLWAPGGELLCAQGNGQMAQVVSDGASGAVVAWQDGRSGSWNVYAQHLDSTGVAAWRAEGVAVSAAYGSQWSVRLASDGAGGAIAAWQDTRASDYCDIYAQRVERSGYLGNPEPFIIAVVDVPGDQGGRVRVSWEPGYVDTLPGGIVDHYEVRHLVPPTPASVPQSARRTRGSVGRGGAVVTGRPGAAAAAHAGAGLASGPWDLVGTVPATGLAQYAFDAPTGRDSILGPNPRTLFRVQARASATDWWASRVDSGYSVDNLAPVAPSGLTGIAAGGHVTLRWRANPDPDVAAYRLHRDDTPDFTPCAGNLVCCTSDTAFADRPTRLCDYKLCAVDIHGNVGPYTTLAEADIVAVGPEPFAPSAPLGRPVPSPARARARVSLDLPSAGSVDLALFDASGRRVRTLHHGAAAAGPREVAFEMRDESRRALPSGVYWLRLAMNGESWVRRVVVAR
ncbi:MAG: hypothetical protein HZB25_14285 [Candidatus Eisenbacteria bacterium]|nr:hypothetical protein [Candidatus Eisenbacteria bacterium]